MKEKANRKGAVPILIILFGAENRTPKIEAGTFNFKSIMSHIRDVSRHNNKFRIELIDL